MTSHHVKVHCRYDQRRAAAPNLWHNLQITTIKVIICSKRLFRSLRFGFDARSVGASHLLSVKGSRRPWAEGKGEVRLMNSTRHTLHLPNTGVNSPQSASYYIKQTHNTKELGRDAILTGQPNYSFAVSLAHVARIK